MYQNNNVYQNNINTWTLGLRDKIVLVIGGAKGIGGATVESFLANDFRVVLVDQDAEIGTALSKSLSPRVSIFKMTLQFIILRLRAGHN